LFSLQFSNPRDGYSPNEQRWYSGVQNVKQVHDKCLTPPLHKTSSSKTCAYAAFNEGSAKLEIFPIECSKKILVLNQICQIRRKPYALNVKITNVKMTDPFENENEYRPELYHFCKVCNSSTKCSIMDTKHNRLRSYSYQNNFTVNVMEHSIVESDSQNKVIFGNRLITSILKDPVRKRAILSPNGELSKLSRINCNS